MAVTLSLFAGAGAQFLDNNGNPLSGGKIYTYQAGTTTPLTTYTTNSGNIAHTNPIVLDAAGRVPSGGEIWLTLGIGYKFIVKTSAEVLIATYDNIPSSAQPPAANDADSIMYEQGYTVTAGSFVIGKMYRIATLGTTDFTLIGAVNNAVGTHFIATGVGSGTGTAELSQTVETKLRETVSVKDFGAVGDGVTNDTAAIQAAINSGAGAVFFPLGTYYTTGTVNIASPGVVLFADDPTTAVIKGDGTNILFSLATTNVAARNLGFDTCLRAFNSSESHIDADNFVFVGCRFTNITLRSITYFDSVNDVNGFVCKDCHFENVGTGVYLSGKTYVKNIQITGNTFINVAGDQALSGAIFVDCDDQGLLTNYKQSYSIVVSDNTIESCHGFYSGPDSYTLAFGIFVVGSGAVIANNTIKDVRTTNGNASISPIGIYTKCVDSIIDANILIDAGEKYAIYSVGLSFDQGPFANGVGGNNIITDNIVTYDAVTPTSDVCILTQSNHVTISDNRLYGNTATILAFDAAGASVSTGRSITGNSLVSSSLIKIATVGSNVSVSNNYLEYTGAAEMRTCGSGSNLATFNTSCMHCGDFPGATVSKTIRSVVVNGNVLHSRSFVTVKTGVRFDGSSASTTDFDTISVNGNNFYNFFNPIIFADLDFDNVQCSSNIGTNASLTYFGLNGLAPRYTNFHKNNNVGTGTKLSNAISQISPDGTLYYIKTDNAGARTFSTDIFA